MQEEISMIEKNCIWELVDILIISLYVDDLLVTGSTIQQVGELKQKMVQVFEMIDLGLMRFFLGM
jgi:hypothetical protein